MTWRGVAMNLPGELRFSGSLGGAALHRHAAVQVIEVTTGAVTVRDASGMERRATHVVIPTGAVHAMAPVGAAAGTITYLDPTRRQAVAHATLQRERHADPASVATWVDQSLDTTPDPLNATVAVHPTLVAALQLATELIDGPLLLKDLSARVGLSPSRLGHLFADELGLTFPAWRRWIRLRGALGAVLEGADLTTAAHAAGFADSAHLSRACRAMFGLTPSEALEATRPTPGVPASSRAVPRRPA